MSPKAQDDTASLQHHARFDLIVPPRLLKDVVGYRDVPDGSGGLVGAAERKLEDIEPEFRIWLLEEAETLKEAWSALEADPASHIAFRHYHDAIHSMLGNAGTMGCQAATRIANPICKLFERAPRMDRHVTLIRLATASIVAAIEEELPEDDPRVVETARTLENFLHKWLAGSG